MWKAAQNLLLTTENLRKRKIVQKPWCQRCGKQCENISHALLNCKASQKTWSIRAFIEDVQAFASQDMLSVFQIVAEKKSKAEMKLFTTLFWATWHLRNLFVFNGKKEDSRVSLTKVEAIVKSCRKALHNFILLAQNFSSLLLHH